MKTSKAIADVIRDADLSLGDIEYLEIVLAEKRQHLRDIPQNPQNPDHMKEDEYKDGC